MSEDKLEKILDWLQDNGVREGKPSSIQEDDEAKRKERVMLKE